MHMMAWNKNRNPKPTGNPKQAQGKTETPEKQRKNKNNPNPTQDSKIEATMYNKKKTRYRRLQVYNYSNLKVYCT